MRLLDHGAGNNSAILEHIFQVYQVTVMFLLCKVIGIVKMNDSGPVCFHDFFRKQDTVR